VNKPFERNIIDLLINNKNNFIIGSMVVFISHVILWLLYILGIFNILVLVLAIIFEIIFYINVLLFILRYDKLKIEVSKDPLTRIYNRKYLFDTLEKEISRVKRTKNNFALAMFDLDDFKAINDCYGHYAGDQILVSITQIVQRIIRQYDIFGRIGGEEFAIILPEINEKDAFDLCERIRIKIQESSLNKKINITISIGIAMFNNKDDNYDLYQKSDKAMYQAKNNGKNQTIVFKEEV